MEKYKLSPVFVKYYVFNSQLKGFYESSFYTSISNENYFCVCHFEYNKWTIYPFCPLTSDLSRRHRKRI